MAEEAAAAAPQLKILNQFIRDLSFENIAAQKGLIGQAQPQISIAVNLDVKNRGEDRYEVALKVVATAKSEEETIFVADLDYAGVFHVTGVPQEQLHPFLLIECPRQLFPFARRILADVSRDGGFPPLMLEPIDFVALYRAELERRAAEQAAAGEVAGTA